MSLSEPMTPPDCDVRTLDTFDLNVERLMASELLALASGDEFKAAVMLWCRAWKQVPAASLPDDDRVLAGFAALPVAKWRKVRAMALRGFVKCQDGRLYHPMLAGQAIASAARRARFMAKREADAGRLRGWRANRKGNADEASHETHSETPVETRFVASVPVSVSVSKDTTAPTEIHPDRAARDARIRAVCGALGLPLEPRSWPPPWFGLGSKLETWLAGGADFQAHVLAACREFAAKNLGATKGPAYLGGIVQRMKREAKAEILPSNPGPDPRAPDSDAKAVQRLRALEAGEWHDSAWGPKPGSAGCLIPAHVLANWKPKEAA